MTSVLERDRTMPTHEGSVGVEERPETKEPERREVPPTPTPSVVRWLGWVLALALVVVSAVVIQTIREPAVSDGSFEANEYARMLRLMPADTSFETNELNRMLALAPVTDASFEYNEFLRAMGLAPAVDTSFETNEFNRMMQLAPTLTRDELIRITTLVR